MPQIFSSSLKGKPAKTASDKSRSPNSLSAFMFLPDNIKFESQEPDETIVLLLRKHWITNLSWILTTVLLILIPVTIFPLIVINNLIPQLGSSHISLISLIWYLLTGSYAWVSFLIWYFTISIVTTERILDIDFVNILHKKLAETRLSKVEDVTQRTGGFLEAFFDYGNVYVQTAGTQPVFLFESAPRNT